MLMIIEPNILGFICTNAQTINGDAFSVEVKKQVAEIIKKDLQKINISGVNYDADTNQIVMIDSMK